MPPLLGFNPLLPGEVRQQQERLAAMLKRGDQPGLREFAHRVGNLFDRPRTAFDEPPTVDVPWVARGHAPIVSLDPQGSEHQGSLVRHRTDPRVGKELRLNPPRSGHCPFRESCASRFRRSNAKRWYSQYGTWRL